jgi:uncharacterized protein (TIGR03118 family)
MSLKKFIALSALTAVIVVAASWSGARAAGNSYKQTNLVSDKNIANHTDPLLLNPWGVANIAGGPFWISDNNSGNASLYDGAGHPIATLPSITIPPASITGAGTASPDGMVWNGNFLQFLVPATDTAANPAAVGNTCIFIFATEDGTISCWAPGNLTNPAIITTAQLIIDNKDSNMTTSPVYKGLAIGTNSRDTFIYATDFRNNRVVAWNSMFGFDATLTAAFKDALIPAGYAPFGIQSLDGNIWVTWAKQDAAKHDPVEGQGLGFVDIFDTNGKLLRRFAGGGVLNAPWAVVRAPSKFGQFGNDILIGNFGSGKINAYDSVTGVFLDRLRDKDGKAIVNDGLWALVFGGDALATNSGVLYFTAGLNEEADGLFGTLTPN